MNFTFKLNNMSEILQKRSIEDRGKVQQFIDSEVLRLDDPYIPKDTGTLIGSGILGTNIGSGSVIYNATYAQEQYYNTAESRSYDDQRGAHWFERMKAEHRDDIVNGAKKLSGGR